MRRTRDPRNSMLLRLGLAVAILCIVMAQYAVSESRAYLASTHMWSYLYDSSGSSDPAGMTVGDVDGDGHNEIVAWQRGYPMTCLESDGTKKWSKNSVVDSMMCDVDDDDKMEVICATTYSPGTSCYVYCLDGDTGNHQWSIPIAVKNGAYACADVDGDGAPEIVIVTVSTSGNNSLCCINARTGSLEWSKAGLFTLKAPLIVNLERNNKAHIITGCLNGSIALTSVTDQSFTMIPAATSVAISPLFAADLDTDGILDIIANTTTRLYCISGKNKTLVWSRPFLYSGLQNAIFTDVNNDGDVDMLGVYRISSSTARVQCTTLQTGAELWSFAGNLQKYMFVTDMNGDTNLELVLSASDSIKVLSGTNGTLLYQMDPVDPQNSYTWIDRMGEIGMSDINSDGYLELVYNAKYSGARYYCSFFECSSTTVARWRQLGPCAYEKASLLRTNSLFDSDNDGVPDDLERSIGLDWLAPDTDGDSVRDGDEINNGTDPFSASDPSLPYNNTNITPRLDDGRVTPTCGNISTRFTFTATYTDAENVTPSYMRLYIDGTSYSMSKLNSSDVTYTDGCVYTFSCTLPPGNHSYYFNASDGFAASSTLICSGPTVTNDGLTLTSPVVSPSSGNTLTTFTYTVTYTNAQNNAPSYVRVHFDGSSYSMSKRNSSDVTYTDGCDYTYSRMLPPGNHSYYFTASDGFASSFTLTCSGPAVTNNAPTLTSPAVSPSSGGTLTTFTYMVTYTDSDNNAPSLVRVHINGIYHSMSKLNSGDVTYTDGCVYTYSQTLSIYNHSYYFSASDGFLSSSTSHYFGPTVTNTTPTLTSGSISPTSGFSTTTFTYTVTYTDADNNAPSYVSVYIDGISYGMSKQNSGDTTYTDGCVYAYSCSLATGSHSYYFIASDGEATSTTTTFMGPTVQGGTNIAPTLATGTVSPLRGTTSTTFTFTVTYTDSDNNAPSYVRVYIDGAYLGMSKQNSGDVTYTDGCTYVFSTTLGVGTHFYYFTASDGNTTTSTSVMPGPEVTCIPSSQPPVLVDGSVSPARGTPGSSFTFSVGYWDVDNDAPVFIIVYVAGSNYTMAKQQPDDMDFTDGCRYVASLTLQLGIYDYMFSCYDGIYGTSTNMSTVVVSYESVSILVEPSSPLANRTISLKSTCTLGFGQVVSWSWTFGDGTPAVSGQNATHVYAIAGTFTLRLSIITDYNVTTTASRTITVYLDRGGGGCEDRTMTASGWAGLIIAVAGLALVFTGTITVTKRRYTRTNARIGQLLASRGKAVASAPGAARYQRTEAIEFLLAEARRRQLPFLQNRQLQRLNKEYRDATERPAIVDRSAFGELVERVRAAILANDFRGATMLAIEMRATINMAIVTGIFSAHFKKEASDAVDALVQLACGRLDKCRGQLDAPAAKQASSCRALLQKLGSITPPRPSDMLLDALSSAGRTLPPRP